MEEKVILKDILLIVYNINKSEVSQYVSGTCPPSGLLYSIWQGYIGVLEIFILYQLRSCILCLFLGSCELMFILILIAAVTSHYIWIFVEVSIQATGMHLGAELLIFLVWLISLHRSFLLF